MAVMSEPRLSSALSREQYQSVLDSVSDAVLTINRDFVITSFNRAAEYMTGFNRVDAVGRVCYEIMRRSVCQNVAECPMTQLFGDGRDTLSQEHHILDRHNRPVTLHVSARALRDSTGTIVGGVETFHEVPAFEAPGAWPTRPVARAQATSAQALAELPILEAAERRTIEDVLRRNHWNRAAVCEELGLSRTTLWRKMRKLGISTRPPRKN